MSLARVTVAFSQIILNHWAATPPTDTPKEGRYKTKGEIIFGFVTVLTSLQSPLLYLTCALELFTIPHYRGWYPFDLFGSTSSPFCPHSSHTGRIPYLYVTPITCFGLLLIAFGSFVRVQCFKALGSLFTVDLCMKKNHRLVTWGPYSIVRHPSYTGYLSIMVGLGLVSVTRGSWIIECTVGSGRTGAIFTPYLMWSSWCAYLSVVLYVRAIAEDEQMKGKFGEEWERYAMRVRYWFVPGLL